MFSPFLFVSLFFLILSGCNQKSKNNVLEKSITHNQNNTVEDSYTTDTLYQALPGRLVNLVNSEKIALLLAQNWVMEEDIESLASADDKSEILLPVRSFSMSSDQSVVKNCRNAIETGSWSFNEAEKIITFKYDEGGTDQYKLRALAYDEMKLTNIGIATESILKFISDGKVYQQKNEDPFTVENNRWRIKPGSREKDENIRKRLKENINFFILYYKDAIARKAGLVSFYGFPSCLNWYAGGIYLKSEETLPEEWKECFYNNAQAKQAYQMMENVMKKKYNWPKEKNVNWIKQNLFVLEQIYQQL